MPSFGTPGSTGGVGSVAAGTLPRLRKRSRMWAMSAAEPRLTVIPERPGRGSGSGNPGMISSATHHRAVRTDGAAIELFPRVIADHLRRIFRSRAMWRFAAADPFTSLAEPEERDRVRDFRAVRRFVRRVADRVREVERLLRLRPPPFDRLPSAFCIVNACAPVTSPGMIKTVLSSTIHLSKLRRQSAAGHVALEGAAVSSRASL